MCGPCTRSSLWRKPTGPRSQPYRTPADRRHLHEQIDGRRAAAKVLYDASLRRVFERAGRLG